MLPVISLSFPISPSRPGTPGPAPSRPPTRYAPLRQTFMDTGNAFILVFDITDDATFEELEPIKNEITKAHPRIKQLPFLIVGNKTDLEDVRLGQICRGGEREEGETA